MAYVTPTAAQMKARFPEFATVSNDLIDMVIQDAEIYVDDSWRDEDRAPAVRFLAAHMLVTQGYGSGAGAGGAGAAAAGPISSLSVGDASVSFGTRAGSAVAGIGSADAALMSTAYGQQFVSLRDANFRGPVLI